MKLNIGDSTLKYIYVIVLLLVGCIVAEAELPIIETPYGAMCFSDDDESTDILEWLAQSSGSQKIDSINSMVIINVAEGADGALGELIGNICLNDFANKPNTIISIYNNYGLSKVEAYCDQIACSICLQTQQTSSHQIPKEFNDLLGRIEKQKITPDKINGLNEILAYILQRIKVYRQELYNGFTS